MDENQYNDYENEELEETPRELTVRQKIFRFLRGAVALLVLLGLLYISGIYQYLFYRQTPSAVRQEKLKSIVEGEMLSVPISIYIINNENILGSQRDIENVSLLVEKASNIWAQAGIDLEVKMISMLAISDEEARLFINNPHQFFNNIDPVRDRTRTQASAISNGVDTDPPRLALGEAGNQSMQIFLTRSLLGINGIAFVGSRNIVVADLVAGYDFRTLAHEIGHILGLGHTLRKDRLMSQGSTGTKLTLKEINIARDEAHRY